MTAVEVRVHRVGWCVLAAVLALGSCGGVRAQATPTIEYRTPVSQEATSAATATVTATVTATATPTVVATATPEAVPVLPEPGGAGGATGQGDDGLSLSPVRPVVQPTAGAGLTYAGQCGPYDATVTRWWPVIIQYPWDACSVLYIINRESGGLNVYNYEGSGACGVMQLLPCEYPDDGAMNIAAGYQKYVAAGGWSPWEVIG